MLLDHDITIDPRAQDEDPAEEPQARKPRRRRRAGVLRWLFRLFLMVTLIVEVAFFVGMTYLYREIPTLKSVKDWRPQLVTTIYSDDDTVIGEFYNERRILVPLEKIPLLLRQAFISAEDSDFDKHGGISIKSIVRAAWKNFQAGRIVQGGSTITQQVTKSLLLSGERTFTRKLREAVLAYHIERALSKEDILYIYLNQVYLGHGAYGVEAAAQNYFGKSVNQLSLAEIAILAGLPKAPGRNSPLLHPKRARERQLYVLRRMVEDGYITAEQAEQARNTTITVLPRTSKFQTHAPYFVEHVRQYLEKKYGRRRVLTGGLKVYTTVNLRMTEIGHQAVDHGLEAMDHRHGYRGPVTHVDPSGIIQLNVRMAAALNPEDFKAQNVLTGVITAYDKKKKTFTAYLGKVKGLIEYKQWRWAGSLDRRHAPEAYQARRKKAGLPLEAGDVVRVRLLEKGPDGVWKLRLTQEPQVQSALMCIQTHNGHVKVMIGGRDWKVSKFNRAMQSRRQPGSSFKPFVYATALLNGFTTASVVIDAPVGYMHRGGTAQWKPHNYDNKFMGRITFRRALQLSRNIPTVKILNAVGVEKVIALARSFGVTAPLIDNLSLGLGASGLSLYEMTRAYSVFANGGQLIRPVMITKVVDQHGKTLQQAGLEARQVLDPETNYLMISLLRGVVLAGTGSKARVLKQPACGKTGTTNKHVDAWFMGFTPRLVTGVWVGYDDQKKSLGRSETGGHAALPIWLDFMQQVLKDAPVEPYPVPKGIVHATVKVAGGMVVSDVFKKGVVPRSLPEESRPGGGNFFTVDMGLVPKNDPAPKPPDKPKTP